MCANYVPVTRASRLMQFFGIASMVDAPDADAFPMGRAPIIRRAPPDTPLQNTQRYLETGIFRFVPDFVSKLEWARHTYNARSETVATKPTYGPAWRAGHRCIVPAEAIYESKYPEGQKPERWRIGLASGEPMGIAGIYKTWTNADGEVLFAFAMLTVNADDHPVMNQFHPPKAEKRMVVILDPRDFDAWLTCSVEASWQFVRQWHGPLEKRAAPLPSRARRTSSEQDAQGRSGANRGVGGSLFD